METSHRETAFATLTVRDLTAAARWYRHVLGFEQVSERPGLNGLPILVHLRRAHDQDLVLMASGSELSDSGNRPDDGITLTFVVEDDVDALATRAEATGARLVKGPLDRPGHIREVTLADADGYRLKFVRRASANRSS